MYTYITEDNRGNFFISKQYFNTKEEAEQLDELSPKTLGSIMTQSFNLVLITFIYSHRLP